MRAPDLPLLLSVRVARFDELDGRTAYALWKLRQDVFVVEQDCPYSDLDGRDLEPGTRHIVLERDGSVDGEGASVVVGTARVLDDGDVWRVGRVVCERVVRGSGASALLMQAGWLPPRRPTTDRARLATSSSTPSRRSSAGTRGSGSCATATSSSKTASRTRPCGCSADPATTARSESD